MPHPKVKISDNSGNEVAVTSNALDVNIAGGTADIDIGDVSLLLGGAAASTNFGSNTDQTLRVTLAADDVLTQHHLGLAKQEDVAHSSGDKGIMSLVVRNDLLATLVGADGDYAPLQVDASGSLYVNIDQSLINPGLTYSGHRGMAAIGLRNDVLDAVALVDDGEYTLFQMNAKGALYVTGGEVENAAVQSEPMLMGGRYDSSARTLGNGDAGAVALNASGHMIMDVVDGGQLDTIIDTLETTLTAIETDQAAIEALLITIDSDTDAIKTAVQVLDDWDDSDYANVNINLAGSDAPTGGGVESGALRVTLANDSTGVISIDDGGNTITVDGTVTANHGITGMVSDGNTTISDSAAEQLDGSTSGLDVACKRVDLMATHFNTGYIWVGDSGVTNNGSGGGIRLAPGDFYSIDVNNLNDIWVIATVDEENLTYIYFT